MTERQAALLTALIREYVRAAEPVGSDVLVERYQLPYSSATVRSELAELEGEGFVGHPHASAGRVPTSRGYRYYVDHVASPTHRMPRKDVERLQESLSALRQEQVRIARRAAKVLAALSGTLAVAGSQETEELHEAGLAGLLEEPEFLRTDLVRDLSHLLDAVEERFDDLTKESAETVHVFIGEENPYAQTQHLALMVRSCIYPSGDRGLLMLIGPTRMRYERNIGLLQGLAELLQTQREEGQ